MEQPTNPIKEEIVVLKITKRGNNTHYEYGQDSSIEEIYGATIMVQRYIEENHYLE